MTTPQTPAGWYPDPAGSGGRRYWDGLAWTDHRAPQAPHAAAPHQPAPRAAAASEDGSRALLVRYLTACALLLAVLLALVIYAALLTAGAPTVTVPGSP
ncbi:MAG: DUF2510 domain-containing protein [Actinomycetota bacterium]|nr:DUF2510 domain-containing protein [Actinomycetota bacterium]